MFLWLRLKIDSHPSFAPSSNGDSGDADHRAGSAPSPDEIAQKVFESLIEEGVLTAPSKLFKAPGGPEWSKDEQADRVFLRLSFSFPAMDEMEEGVKRLGRALRKEWKLD
jgi:aromatic amino acid aminotransferase I